MDDTVFIFESRTYNTAFNLFHFDPSASTRLKNITARRNAQQAVRNAKSTWI